MSMMGEENYFLGLQVKQHKEGIFIYQAKYNRDLNKKFGAYEKSSLKILINTSRRMEINNEEKDVDQTMYR